MTQWPSLEAWISFGLRWFSGPSNVTGPSNVLSRSPFIECMRHGPSNETE